MSNVTLYSVDRDYVNEIRECVTYNDFLDITLAYRPFIVENPLGVGDEMFIPLANIGKKLFILPRHEYYEHRNTWHSFGDALFLSNELRERFEDYDAIVLTEESVYMLIGLLRKSIIEKYKSMTKDNFDKFVSDKIEFWKLEDNLDLVHRDRYKLVKDTLEPEHAIWGLIEIAKTFDWGHRGLLLMK